jgi:hypothetical protein
MRVRGLRAVGFVAALVVLLSGCDWTMFGYDATHSRSSPDTGVSATTVGDLSAKWAATTGGMVSSSPTLRHWAALAALATS